MKSIVYLISIGVGIGSGLFFISEGIYIGALSIGAALVLIAEI
jgi:hypothetical protein